LQISRGSWPGRPGAKYGLLRQQLATSGSAIAPLTGIAIADQAIAPLTRMGQGFWAGFWRAFHGLLGAASLKHACRDEMHAVFPVRSGA